MFRRWFGWFHLLHRVTRQLDQVLDRQETIIKELKIMSKADEQILAYSAKIDAATSKLGETATAISARIQKLIDAADSGLSETAKATLQEDVDALDAVAASLEPLGKDPVNPVPVEPPTPPVV